MTSYKGIGKKTADALLERFGTAVFQALHERPEEVKAVLDERRATALLDQWKGDFARRTKTTASPPQTEAAASPAGEAKDQSVTPKSGGRGRRGGRGRSGTRKEPASIK